MFIKVKYNKIGWIEIIDKNPKPINEIVLSNEETIYEIKTDISETLAEIKSKNNYLVDGLIKNKRGSNKIINNKINIENISANGFNIISQYKTNPSEANLGILISLYNKENWNNDIICCGDYALKINKFIDELEKQIQ